MSGTPKSTPIARRCLVSGRVQGVNYRASARRRALAANIHGLARNLPDGRVEVLAFGEPGAVEDFIAWLWIGPASARVTAVLVEELTLPDALDPGGFTTG